MATATERKFTSLRKRLDQLGYRQPLVIDSLPLVEKLFGDLIHTTESLKSAKQQLGKQREKNGVWEQHVEPYRNDNARLVKENNELHQQVIKLKESSEQRLKDLKVTMRRLEHENADLKFLNTQYMQKLRAQEKETHAKNEKILELQEKNLQAVIQTPGGKKKQIPFRRQRMDIDSTLPANPPPSIPRQQDSRPLPPPTDPYIADLLQVADQRIIDLQRSVEQGEIDKRKLETAIHSMRKQIDNREAEIERLTGALKGGRPPVALAAEGARESNERMIAHLNIQIDFLQQATRELESKLAESDSAKTSLEQQVRDLSGRNARICSELEEISGLVKEMKAENEEKEANFRQQISSLESERASLESERRSLEVHGEHLEKERDELMADNRKMAELLAAGEGESREVADMVERLAEDRKQLQRQCTQLRLKVSSLEQQVKGQEGVAAYTPSHSLELRKLRKERNELREAVTNFETELMQIQSEVKVLAEDRDNFKLLYQQVNRELSRVRQQSRTSSSSSSLLGHRTVGGGGGGDTQLELRRALAECQSLRERLKTAQDTQQHSSSTLQDQIAELQLQLDETLKDRDELSGRVVSLREMVKSLEGELQESSAALSSASTELARSRARCSQLQGLLEGAERGRAEQQAGVRREAGRRDEERASIAALRSRVVGLEGEVVEREGREEELHHALSQLDREHDALRREADLKDEQIEQLRSNLQHKEHAREDSEKRLLQAEADLSQARGLGEGREREVASLRSQLTATQTQLEELQGHSNALSQQSQQLREDLNTMTQENQALHEELQRAVQERDSLKLTVEEYAQSILRFEEAVSVKEQEKAELVGSYQSLSQDTEKLDSTLRRAQGEATTARMELATMAQEKLVLEQQMSQLTAEVRQREAALEAYEHRLSNVTAALARLEGTLRQEQDEKKALMADIAATRELCVQLDHSKDSLTRQLASHAAAYEQLQGQLQELQNERDAVKQQWEAERQSSESLQKLLSSERKKEFQAYHTSQEREGDMQQLRQQLARLEADRLSLTEQLRSVRSEAAVKTEENQRLKSELASEKFQREHLKQQQQQQQQVHTKLTLTSSALLVPSSSTTDQAALTQQLTESLGGQDVIAKEKHSLATESSRVVGELMSPSPHSSSATTSPPSSNHEHSN